MSIQKMETLYNYKEWYERLVHSAAECYIRAFDAASKARALEDVILYGALYELAVFTAARTRCAMWAAKTAT